MRVRGRQLTQPVAEYVRVYSVRTCIICNSAKICLGGPKNNSDKVHLLFVRRSIFLKCVFILTVGHPRCSYKSAALFRVHA